MTYFSHIRAGLMASALLLTTALASPALAEALPEISPRQIASDVEVKYNPETGAREYIAPSFDPFEEDRALAGTASLRSVSNATTIDGQSVRGGALLDMTFYYNSASNDPYDTRGYDDAAYLSGELAPVIRRDTRILECNEHVQDVVYYHEDYYRPSLYVNLFRPYRHYRGHHGFNSGYYGYNRGFGFNRGFRGVRGRGFRNRRGLNSRRNARRDNRGFSERVIDRVREENGRSRSDRREDRERRERGEGVRGERGTADRALRRENRANRQGRRANRTERRLENIEAGRARRNDRTVTPRAATPRRERTPRAERSPRIDRALREERILSPERATRTQGNGFAARAARRVESRSTPRPAPPRAATPRPAPAPRAAAPAPRAERAAPASRRQRTERSRPARAERPVRRARDIKSRNAPRRNSGRKGNIKRRMMGFLPMASAWSRNVVRNVDVQCAREEMLTVHIPQERLDAARFDGLTVLVLDRTGAELPVFIPPNYIEGFRQAVSSRTAPSVSYQEPGTSAPDTRAPIYQEPRPFGVEEAPCPAGTTKQNDGTCLQGGTNTYGGYPAR